MLESMSEHVKLQINNWLATTTYNEFYNEIKTYIIGQPNLKIVVANVYNYLLNIVSGKPVNNNMLLAAPSGTGKTETYRALRDYFENKIPDMPIYSFDASLLTASGYKGSEPYEICAPFFDLEMEDAVGICFLDEFDKKLTPSFNTNGFDTNAEAQANMLTIVEGTILNGKNGAIVDTGNIMFVGLGSFDNFRKSRETVSKTIGFENMQQTVPIEHYAPITRESMIKCGGIHELLGRFPVIVNYDKLTPEHVKLIIKKITNEIEFSFDCEISLSSQMMDSLLDVANNEFGCRIFDSMIRTATIIAYSNAMVAKIPDRILSITIHSAEEATFVWREYNEIERAEQESYEKFLKRIREAEQKETKNQKAL